jgi:hypothetical protein
MTDLDAELRQRLVEQQTIHGLLRHLHSPDAAAREMRIQRVLVAMGSDRPEVDTNAIGHDPDPSPTPDADRLRQRGWRLAMAALVLIGGTLLVTSLIPHRLPLARAVVGQTLQHLEQIFDRAYDGRWTLESWTEDDGSGDRVLRGRNFKLFVGGRGRSLVRIDTSFGVVNAGCFAGKHWIRMPGWRTHVLKHSGPLRLPDGAEFDLGLMQIDNLLSMLPAEFDLQTLGRLRAENSADAATIHIRARRPANPARRQSAMVIDLWSEEVTGLLRKLEVVSDGPFLRGSAEDATANDIQRPQRRMRWTIEYVGPADLPDTAYQGQD